jgi:hypothetical protein
MDSKTLGSLVLERINAHPTIDWDIMSRFVGVTRVSARRWINRNASPRGENLNRLWHYLAAIGIDSPELEKLPPYNRYIGELHAYGIVKFMGEDEDRDLSLRQLLNTSDKEGQDILDILRGDAMPTNPFLGKIAGQKELSVQELESNYGDQLAEMKNFWREDFKRALSAEPMPLSFKTAQMRAEKPTPASPAQNSEATSPPVELPETQAPDDEPIQTSVSEQDPKLVVSPPALPLTTVEVSAAPSDNRLLMLRLAEELTAAVALLNYATSDACSSRDRQLLRQLVGQETMFAISVAINRLQGERAFNEGRKQS